MAPQHADELAALAETIVANIATPFPYKTGYVLESDADCAPPQKLTPAFANCFDWHSSVHNHWALVRILRRGVEHDSARDTVTRSLSTDNLEAEREHLVGPSRRGFELPYGIAWLLLLAAEIEAADRDGIDGAAGWQQAIGGLSAAACSRFVDWLERLPGPVRSGQHSQSAFALGLALRAAPLLASGDLSSKIEHAARQFYGGDVDAAVELEPSAWDFLSPSLAEADLMSLVLSRDSFVAWHDSFLRDWKLPPAKTTDRSDGKLAHLDGLNFSRAWMLRDLHRALGPDGGPRHYTESAAEHASAGLDALALSSYEGLHWLPTFAVSWLTGGPTQV